MSDEVTLLIFDPALMEELLTTRDPRRQALLPIPYGDPAYDVEAALLTAMQFPTTGPFDLAYARYHRVCVLAHDTDRPRLLDVVAKVLWPMVGPGLYSSAIRHTR